MQGVYQADCRLVDQWEVVYRLFPSTNVSIEIRAVWYSNQDKGMGLSRQEQQ